MNKLLLPLFLVLGLVFTAGQVSAKSSSDDFKRDIAGRFVVTLGGYYADQYCKVLSPDVRDTIKSQMIGATLGIMSLGMSEKGVLMMKKDALEIAEKAKKDCQSSETKKLLGLVSSNAAILYKTFYNSAEDLIGNVE
jgi:hypothetical protein